MKVQIDYYKMAVNKAMGDGTQIPQDQELILIKEDDSDGTFFFETHNDDYKKLFWAKQHEVEFVQSVEEDWDEEKVEERNRYIAGEFL